MAVASEIAAGDSRRQKQQDNASPILQSAPDKSTRSGKRAICQRCERPYPRTCLCPALPEKPLTLQKCRILALQHPHEIRRKNRSLFLAEFCLSTDSITTIRTRRFQPANHHFGTHHETILSMMAPERHVWLVVPHPQAKPLHEVLEEHRRAQTCSSSTSTNCNTSSCVPPLTLIFLDATWKFATEMERASEFPVHTQYVYLDANDLRDIQPKRFDIRTPPSPQHLSTAECLAFIVSKVEGNTTIYDTIMKPLDLMVSQWHSFSDSKKVER